MIMTNSEWSGIAMGIVILCIAIGAVLYFNYQEKKDAEAKKRQQQQ